MLATVGWSSAVGAAVDAGAAGCNGASVTRKLWRRGRPNVCPPKVTLNNSACASREINTAVLKRPGSR